MVDKNIPFQQNVQEIPFTIIVLDVFRNTLKNIQILLPRVLDILNKPASEKVIVINEV